MTEKEIKERQQKRRDRANKIKTQNRKSNLK